MYEIEMRERILDGRKLMEQTVIKEHEVVPSRIAQHLDFINVAVYEHGTKFTSIELQRMEDTATSIAATCRRMRGNV